MAIIQIQSIGAGSAWNDPYSQEMLIGAVFETTAESSFMESDGIKSLLYVKPLKLADGTKPLLNEYSFFDIEYKILFK